MSNSRNSGNSGKFVAGEINLPSRATKMGAAGVEIGTQGPPQIEIVSGEINRPSRVTKLSETGVEIGSQGPPSIEMVEEIIDGRYRLGVPLGQGGMGIVYKTTHIVLNKEFAMKVIRPEYLQNEEAAERFMQEAKTASALRNPHIIDISDAGRFPSGEAYIVMEYLEGQPLSRILADHQFVPVPRLMHIAGQLAKGLSAAHRAGIVHRDLKPDNIFLSVQGDQNDFVKILDFGIAKVMGSDAKRLTQNGMIVGTAEYISPEQATGGVADQRSDIYAFGIMLYEMATGEVPFTGEDVRGTLLMHFTVPPTPIRERESQPQVIPPGLEALIMKALAKDPADRFQTMDEVIAELERLKSGSNPEVRMPKITPPESEQIPIGGIEIDLEGPEMIAPARRRWPLFGGLAAMSLTALIAAILVTRKTEQKTAPQALPPDAGLPDAAPNPVDAPVPPDAPPPSVVKKVALSVEPKDAHVFLGGRDLGAKRVVVAVEVGSPVEVEIRRPGFKSKKIRLDGSEAGSTVRLERIRVPVNIPDKKDPKDNPKDGGGSYKLGGSGQK